MSASLTWSESTSSKTKLSLPWRSFQLLVPHKLRRKIRSKLRSRQSPTSSVAALQTSFSPFDTIRDLQAHRWTINDGQWLLIAILGIFCLSIMETPGPLIKTAVASLLLISVCLPITRQFFLPFMPILAYLIWFYACKFVPASWRPVIWVKVLPALENILYGANLSNIISAHTNTALDLLAWFPYGIGHFGAPCVCAVIMFVFAPPKTIRYFGYAFGWMNIIGVTTQVLFPCSSPWYENMYGLAPANFSMKGSPAGLARIDALFGADLYTSTFTASPMVFGAFPSLHAADATLEALFMSHCFPKLTPLFVTYVLWLWWATMYLSHHYAVDLVGGSMFAATVFFFAKAHYLPRPQDGKVFRWDYDYIECGEEQSEYEYLIAGGPETELPDAEEWAVGSSSSVSSGSMSPKAYSDDEAKSLSDTYKKSMQ